MNLNFLKTLYMIARVTPPYEQTGKGPKTLLILGDSTGYGTGASRKSESLAGLIGSSYPDITIINKSVNGRTALKLQEDIKNLSGSYEIILLQIGANDLLRGESPEETIATITSLSNELAQHSKRIIVITSGNLGAATRYNEEESQKFTNISRTYNALMIQRAAEAGTFEFVPLFTEPAIDPFMMSPKTYISSDGLHPTSAGYALWFKSLKPLLDKQ